MQKFLKFIREQGVVGLAIGFILGGAVSKVVSALVDDIISPIIGLILGAEKGLSTLGFNIFSARISIGHFITVAIDFIIISAVVYFIFKGLKFDKFDKKAE